MKSRYPVGVKALPSDSTTQDMLKRILAAARPSKVILFGSRGRGEARVDSDYDWLVIEKEVPSKYQEILKIRRALRGFGIPIDVLVVSEREFLDRCDTPSNVYYWAKHEGRILYEAA